MLLMENTMRHTLGALGFVAGLILVCGGGVVAQDAVPPPPDVVEKVEHEPWLRVVDDGDLLKLEVAVREFSRVESPEHTLTVAGAIHIADRAFYKELQSTLDPLDLVLFEGVAPPGTGLGVPDEQLDDKAKVKRTRDRIRLLAALFEREKAETKVYPASVDALAEAMKQHGRIAGWITALRNDAWGRPLAMMIVEFDAQTKDGNANGEALELSSLGADGAPGGTGINADLKLDDILAKEPLTRSELGLDHGIQARLAKTFRLRFQLEEMNTDGPNYKNSDMAVDQIEQRLNPDGEEGENSLLFSLLDGSSFPAKMANMLLGLIERVPGAAARGKLMMIEMLAHADDDLMAAGMEGGEEMITVIIDERNQVVIDDLAQELAKDATPKSVGIVYGAGHMPDLVERLEDQLGYKLAKTRWVTAITLDLQKAGIERSEVAMTRAQITRQLAMMKKAAKKD